MRVRKSGTVQAVRVRRAQVVGAVLTGVRGLLGVGEPVLARSGHGALRHHQRHRHYQGARLRGGTVGGCRRVPARGGLSASNA